MGNYVRLSERLQLKMYREYNYENIWQDVEKVMAENGEFSS